MQTFRLCFCKRCGLQIGLRTWHGKRASREGIAWPYSGTASKCQAKGQMQRFQASGLWTCSLVCCQVFSLVRRQASWAWADRIDLYIYISHEHTPVSLLHCQPNALSSAHTTRFGMDQHLCSFSLSVLGENLDLMKWNIFQGRFVTEVKTTQILEAIIIDFFPLSLISVEQLSPVWYMWCHRKYDSSVVNFQPKQADAMRNE